MLQEIKELLLERYGSEWLNRLSNQNGLADDLTIFDNDEVRVSRKYGLIGRGLVITPETELIARYEVMRSVSSLFELDAIFYAWWGRRASENISVVQREIADDEVIYHFITGSATHGHSGRVILMGRVVRAVIRQRLERRLARLDTTQTSRGSQPSPIDRSTAG